MTNDQNHPEQPQESNQPMSAAALLRAAADGELTDCQCKQLEAYCAQCCDAQSQIEFEKALKKCCGRVMAKPCCPEDLRAKVLAIAECSCELNSRTRSQSFWARLPMMGLAAAVLIMVAGTLIWQSLSVPTGSAPSHLSFQQASYFQRVSDFVLREHNRCEDETAAESKLVEHDFAQATQYFSQAFGTNLSMPDLEELEGRIEFFGGGDCHVPSTVRSGHLRFDAITPTGDRLSLSLFISPNPDLLPMVEGTTYSLDAKVCQDAGVRLFAWVRDGVQYLLVSEADGSMCANVRDLLKAPKNLSSI